MTTARDQAVAHALRATLPDVRHRQISVSAAGIMTARIVEAPHVENLFACDYDFATETLTGAQWICRGSRNVVAWPSGAVQPGQIAVHTHPGPQHDHELQPSEQDVQSAAENAARGIGSAIVDNSLELFLLLSPPRVPAMVDRYRSWRLVGKTWGLTFTRTTLTRLAARSTR